ncbi:MAG: hypothetical protein KGZ58_09420 [Ignavibacteriales bacterium]|nr:hypothetical protein [Ignavibacteriales bacterium]
MENPIVLKNKFSVPSYQQNILGGENISFPSFSSENTTSNDEVEINGKKYPRFTNEFWTAKQRQASSLHEISYRACFKPQLPRFFIELFTKEKDVVYDPFSGRGTTAIEAGLLNRNVIANDINPLSAILCSPRFFIPEISEVEERLYKIKNLEGFPNLQGFDLSMFYHKKTLAEIVSLKNYLSVRKESKEEDALDKWIRMVATNRLTGHSINFFSVYTFPPNQAVSAESQKRINEKRSQKPEYKNVREIILKKTKDLLSNVTEEQKAILNNIGQKAKFISLDARKTKSIKSNSVQLTVTSPPFLDVVQYANDNWLRCWFNSLDAVEIANRITMSKKIEDWCDVMKNVFKELFRITKPNGFVAFEVGEIRNGKIKLDEFVVPLGEEVGFRCKGIFINEQSFTKTSNIWGINNNSKGTNTNRIVVFEKT